MSGSHIRDRSSAPCSLAQPLRRAPGTAFCYTGSMVGLEQDISTFWTLLFDIITDAEKRLAAHLNRHGLTPPQFFVLKTLIEHDGSCAIGQIAREHHLSRATMTGVVQRLESVGLVERQRSEADGRSVRVLLTVAGRQRFGAVRDDALEQLQALLAMVREDERAALKFFLSRYLELVGRLAPDEVLPDVLSGDAGHG